MNHDERLQVPLFDVQTVFSAPLRLSSYLDASATEGQPLCGNTEGWGPLSPFRYDFTPCFLDVWISTVAIGGIVGGAGALWFLLKKHSAEPVKKNWHFWAKLVSDMIMKSR